MATNIAIFTIVTITIFQTTKSCTDYKACESQSLSSDKIQCSAGYACYEAKSLTTESSSGFIECAGHESCHQSSLISSTANVYCTGDWSCSNTQTISAGTLQCAGDQSCQDNTDDPKTYIINNLLYCGGRESCQSNTWKPGKKAFCDGLQSCASAEIVGGDVINCNGAESCSDSLLSQQEKIVSCTGIKSCDKARIKAARETRLYGSYSGSKSRLDAVQSVKAYGYRSLFYARIDSGNSHQLEVKLFGEEAGNGLFVVCRAGASCNLVCKSTACDGTEYQCAAGSVCTISPSGCLLDNSVDEYNGIACPLVTDGTDKPKPKNVLQQQMVAEEMQTVELYGDITEREIRDEWHGDYGLATGDVLRTCDEKEECDGNVFKKASQVRCRGLKSCTNAEIRNPSKYHDEWIMCHGQGSCQDAVLSSEHGDVDCWGKGSCIGAKYSGSNVQCSGLNACWNVEYEGVKTRKPNAIECSGTTSCKEADLMAEGRIDCTGNKACVGAVMDSHYWSAFCYGSYGCEEARIQTNNQIYCNAKASCNGGELVTDNDIMASAYLAANGAILKGDRIVGTGYRSLAFSMIDSGDRENFEVGLYGHQTGYGASVVCREGSRCEVICKSTGCGNLDYYCLNGGVCEVEPVECNEIENNGGVVDGVDCPNMVRGIEEYEMAKMMKRKDYDVGKDDVYVEIEGVFEDDEKAFDMVNAQHHNNDNDKKKKKANVKNGDEILYDSNIEFIMLGKAVLGDNMKIMVGIGSVVFILASMMYLGYRIKFGNSDQYEWMK